jgi:glycerophosphoryl diester phosphodiesterase
MNKPRIKTNKYFRWIGYFLLGIIVVMSGIYGSLACTQGEPAVDRVFFKQSGSQPLVIAHRGGGGLFPENTLYAFKKAADLGVDVIELDVRGTSDGELVVIHDPTVQRTTDGTGRVNELTLSELKKLDAGYRFSPDGLTFPLRQNGINVPTLREVFAALPKMRFNIEPKQAAPSIIKPLCKIINEYQMVDRVVVGSFQQGIIDEFRRDCANVATSASTGEVGKFLAMYKTALGKSYTAEMQALQVPEFVGITKEFVEAAHERNLKVHVWTVNETNAMERLLKMGVDGIMTDYPDRLLTVMRRQRSR